MSAAAAFRGQRATRAAGADRPYREMNEAYAEFFPGAKPARPMVRFGAEIPGVLVAMEGPRLRV